MRAEQTLILGLGNDILSDDGMGFHIVSDLKNLISKNDVVFETASCGGLELAEFIKDYNQAILIDAIRTTGGKPGDVFYFSTADFMETSHLSNLHDVSFLTALKLFRSMELKITHDIHIIAIEIIEDREFSNEFSPQIKMKYPAILKKVFKLVDRIIS